MSDITSRTIFDFYYQNSIDFVDRYMIDEAQAVDVIIPTYNTHHLWRTNLFSIYREIPIHRLLIGDGGCTDDTLDIAREFPRVEVLDQSERKSLGYCLRELIEQVETEWFVYLHADVYLPPGWFDAMVQHQVEYDWFECNRRKTVMLDYADIWQNAADRPFSGSQMGRRAIFESFLNQIDDDYLYRNEDLILRSLVEQVGGRYGRVAETFHYHQIINRFGAKEPDFARIDLVRVEDAAWSGKVWTMQLHGVIKYTQPDKSYLVQMVYSSMRELYRLELLNWRELAEWTVKTNPNWLPYVRGWRARVALIRPELTTMARAIRKIFQMLFFCVGLKHQ